MKKWLSLLLAGLMILSMAVSALAASPVYTAPGDGHDHGGNGYYIIPVIDLSKNPNYTPATEDEVRVYCPKCGDLCYPVYEDAAKTVLLGYKCAKHGLVKDAEGPVYNKVYCPTCKRECKKYYDLEGNIIYWCENCQKIVGDDPTVTDTPYCPYCYQKCTKVFDSHTGKFLGYTCAYHGYVTPVFDKPDDTKVYCPYCGSLLSFVYDKNGLFVGYKCAKHGMVKPVDVNPDKTRCPWCGSECSLKYTDINGSIRLGYYCPKHGFVKVSDSYNYYFTISLFAGYGGTVTMNAQNPVKAGDNRVITITPDYGYAIAAVYINGYYYGTGDTIRLESIYQDYSIQVKFRKVDTRNVYTIDTSVVGGGSVYATVNGKNAGAVSKLSVTYADTVVLRFVPSNKNYSIASVSVNGNAQGAVSTLTLKRATQNVSVAVKFQWNNPYSDVNTHLAAVEYVTEQGIMGSPNTRFDTDKFMGNSVVSLRAFACYLAELADVNDNLDTVAERITWAKNAGIITNADDLSKTVTLREAAALVEVYVRYLERVNNTVIVDLKNVSGAQNVAVAIGFLTATQYQNNGLLTRYDMAEICYGISLLK